MKLNFGAGPIILQLIQKLDIDGLEVEGGTVSINTADRPMAEAYLFVTELVGIIRTRAVELGAIERQAANHLASMISQRSNILARKTGDTIDNKANDSASEMRDNSHAYSDISHSLPTGDLTISNASQQSDKANEKEIENGEQTFEEYEAASDD